MKSLKNIYFVQAGNLYGVNAYLPYASGCIAAYAWNNPLIREHYRLGHFTFLRTPIEQAVDAFEDPYMLAFSCSAWNFEYHKALAQAAKARWPGCLILFGGHQVLNDSFAQLEELPFVDFLIHKAGEIPFEQLLLALLGGTGLSGVPSLSYRSDGTLLRTKNLTCQSCNYPSPYLTGLFDGLFAQYPSLLFTMTFETNRGCPYNCSYCDWGTERQSLLTIPMERVKAEIDWAAQHKIEYVLCADSNFGMLERDEDIADYLIACKQRTGYPAKIRACLAKDSDEAVFRINQKLSEHGLHNGAALSFQSMAPAALESIGRQNLDMLRFRDLISLYVQAGVPMFTELILGLPGESLESYARGVGVLFEAGLQGALEVFRCELLPNAEMSSPAYRAKHGIKAVRVRQYQWHSSPETYDEIPEYAELVHETAAMPVHDWVSTNVFSDMVQGFHCLGLLPCFAALLHGQQQLPYERFYLDLMDYARSQPSALVGELLVFFEQRYWALSQGDGQSFVYYHPNFGEVTWSLGEAMFLRAAFESGRLYDELPDFLMKYDIDAGLLSELIRYQRTIVHLPEAPPPCQSFAYDFPSFFAALFAGQHATLEKKRVTLLFPAQADISWPDFARENVWYGRRKGLLVRKGYEVLYE